MPVKKYAELLRRSGWGRSAIRDFEECANWVVKRYGASMLDRIMDKVKELVQQKKLSPHLLFWAIRRTGSLTLLDEKYLSFAKELGPVAGDWLWAIGATRNLKALTHPKVLKCGQLLKENKPIAFHWFMALAKTNAVNELTSEEFWGTLKKIGYVNTKIWLSTAREKGKKVLKRDVMEKLRTLKDPQEIIKYLHTL